MIRLLAPALLLAGPALATGDNVSGEFCPQVLLVQSRDCTATLIRHCDGAPSGAHTFLTYDAEGLISSGVADAQGAWLESFFNLENIHERATGTPADPVSLDALLESGVDTFDFMISHTEFGGPARNLRVIGADMLTGDSVTIDGVPLQVVATDLRILEADGTTYYQTRGQQYVSPEMRLWFLGTDSVVGDDGSVTNYDATPAAFLFPGDPGFDDETPLYGCAAGAEDGVKTAPLPAGPGKNTNK